VGQNGTILRTTDGGATWQAQSVGTNNVLWAIRFLDANTGIVLGDNGTILRTTDGGAHWSVQPTDTHASLWAVSFPDVRTGFVVGDRGAVLRSVNGGITWQTLHDEDFTMGGLRGVAFTDANRGTAVSAMGLWRTTDAGATWQVQFAPSVGRINGIAFTDPNTAMAVGNNGLILRTTTAGEPAPK